MGTVISKGSIIGERSLVENISAAGRRINPWEDKCSPKTRAKVYAHLQSVAQRILAILCEPVGKE